MSCKGIFQSRKFWVTVAAVAAAISVHWFDLEEAKAKHLSELIVFAGAVLVGGFALKDGLTGNRKR